MTWVKLSDLFAEDPRWEVAGPVAMAMHVAGICYCNRLLTDGFLSAGAARRLLSGADTEAAIQALVDTDFWIAVDGGFELVDYDENQPLAEKVRADRKARADRQAKWRASRSASTNASRSASTNGSTNASRSASTTEPYAGPPVIDWGPGTK